MAQYMIFSECSIYTKKNVYWLFIIARTWKQPRCPSADEWIRKLWCIYTMEYYSAIEKNTFESVLMRWMKLEPIIQSEVSQKEKHQYSLLTHIYMVFRKMVTMTLYARQQNRHRCKEVFWTLWEKARMGWFERIAVNHVYYHMWNWSLVQVQCMRQGSGLVHWDDLEGWEGEVGGRGVQDGEQMYTHGWFMSMCGKKKKKQQHYNTVINLWLK